LTEKTHEHKGLVKGKLSRESQYCPNDLHRELW
jgi:hypothetical protein